MLGTPTNELMEICTILLGSLRVNYVNNQCQLLYEYYQTKNHKTYNIRTVWPAKTQISLYIHMAMVLVYPSVDSLEAVEGTYE